MLYVEDLRLEAEILPLFDFTYNDEARQAVGQLLRELPATLALVLERQATVRGFLANWEVVADFSYPKLQFQETRAFLLAVSSGAITLETSPLKVAAQLAFSEQARYQIRARYVQALQFLHRLQQHYLQRLDASSFPASFQRQLLVLAHFLERFSLDDTSRAVQEDAFSVARTVRAARQFQAIRAPELAAFLGAFYQFEAYWSVAKGIYQRGLHFPVFQESGLQLTDFYHPLLKQPVANTLLLEQEHNVVVLTGPNMSGKSTLLRAVGLCVYLAHAGLGVPAARCALPFFTTIVVAIDLRDNPQNGYSHFMTELQQLKAVLLAAGSQQRTFAIFDELFRGTNADDALEITRATVRGLSRFPQSYFLVSTHLLQLQSQLGDAAARAYCIECVLQEGVPVFSYRLQAGWSSLKIGQLLFAQQGLNRLLQPE